jgi:hypothetical protein
MYFLKHMELVTLFVDFCYTRILTSVDNRDAQRGSAFPLHCKPVNPDYDKQSENEYLMQDAEKGTRLSKLVK